MSITKITIEDMLRHAKLEGVGVQQFRKSVYTIPKKNEKWKITVLIAKPTTIAAADW